LKKLSGNESIAEEITSETFFKAINSIDKFRGDCDIRVWLCQIAKNSYYTFIKKQNSLVDLNILENINMSGQADNIEEKFIVQDQAMKIHTCLHDIAEPYKEVFMLRVFGEFNFNPSGVSPPPLRRWDISR